MMRSIWVGVFLSFAWLAGAQELPPELQPLTPFLGDEARLVDDIRAFDKLQTGLAKADEEAAARLPTDEAKSKREEARKRIGLVRQAYDLGLSHYASNARLHNYYGELLYDWCKEIGAALKEWNTALALDPKLSGAHNNLGLHFFHTGDYRMGLPHMDEALRLDPKNADYLYNMAQLYLVHWPQIQKLRGWRAKRVYREAMNCSRKAAQLRPNDYDLVVDYAVNFFAGQRFAVEVNWEKAAKAWQTARTQTRNDVELFYTWLNEARVWIAAKQNKNAEMCLKAALTIRPESEVAKELLEKVRMEQARKK